VDAKPAPVPPIVEAVETAKPAAESEVSDAPKPAASVEGALSTPAASDTATGAIAPAAAPAAEPVPTTAPELRKAVEAPAEPPQATPAAAVPSATGSPQGDDLSKPAPTMDPPKPPVLRTKAADQPVKRAGQVAVFVSRREKKIFVREGMVPLFDMPITIDNPDQPLGTHVYTALAVTDGGAGMRWNLMTIPTSDAAPTTDGRSRHRGGKEAPQPVRVASKPASTAAEALDRIQFPKEAVDRIGEILIPGSSLVVSDTGISGETGKGTDFIVLTR
jgi:hypothetical protein